MDLVIVYKADGTMQCEDGAPIPLPHHAGELRKLGASKICGQANLRGPNVVIDLCGAPTGRVNAFAIPKDDWAEIVAGTVGTLGFRLWCGAPYPELDLDKGARIASEGFPGTPAHSAGVLPILLREIIGHPGRCYRQGDALSRDYVPERVNIEHDEHGRISDVWLG